jgi:hypothetical protein
MKGGMEVLFGSTCVLRTTPELAAAMTMERNQNWSQHFASEDPDIESEEARLLSPSSALYRIRITAPFPLQDREIVAIGVITKLEEGTYMITYEETELHNDTFTPSPEYARLTRGALRGAAANSLFALLAAFLSRAGT